MIWRIAVLCNHPSAEDAAKAVASIPMGAFMNFKTYALSDFDETMKAYLETIKRAERPIKFYETPIKMRPAPKLGEHNDYVLRTILGLSKAEIEILEKEQIIGTVPIGLSSRIG